MKLQISDLIGQPPLTKVVIHSLERMLYQISVELDGEERLLYGEDGEPFRSFSLEDIRELLEPLQINELVLRHQNTFDEMCGQPETQDTHAFEALLAWQASKRA